MEMEEDDYDLNDFINEREYYYIFFLERNVEHCYSENMDAGSEFNFEVESADGFEGSVYVRIDAPNSVSKRYDLLDQIVDRYTIDESGILRFCFYAHSNRKIWMYYSIYGSMPSNTTNSDLTRLNHLLKDVHQYLSGNSRQINTLIHQSFIHVNLLLQKHRVIFYFSSLICVAIILSSMGQVYMVKKLFYSN
ncbi:hypothetical protein RF11_06777 [Thelohanellus kitauei]|uniref:GOLD domain-containing protein n=1 Tax=Thelohanellus kitauei TaxID=669202 RepID=A0A0C2JGH4_THEKT|nr:hypothetical protein RF11_06777 [Thelohanellus kitauei]